MVYATLKIKTFDLLDFETPTNKITAMKNAFLPALCLGVFLFAGSLANSGYAQSAAFNDTLQKIDLLFKDWGPSTPGAAVSISRKGTILYQRAFGMADLEHNVPNTTATVFESGSVSKQFTAAAVLLLVEEGKIGLQDDIRKHFPDFPDYGTVITVEHLLHHTSGLRDWGSVISLSGWPRGTRVYTPAHVREIIWQQKGLNFSPGTAYGYSNSNYNLLGFLVEKVSGQPLEVFTQERLFKPAGMEHTRWRDNFRAIVPDRAVAYSKKDGLYQQNMPFENTFGHGALLTTISDLEKWNRRWTLHTLGEALNKLQRAKTKLANGKEIGYACGVGLGRVNGVSEIAHSGATAGYRAWLAYYPDKELSVVFLSNDGDSNPASLGGAIAKIFFGEEKRNAPTMPNVTGPIAIKKEQLASFEGMYKSTQSNDVQEFVVSKDSLRFKNTGLALTPVAGNKFYREGFVITFPENKMNPSSLHFRNPGGDTATYERVTPFNPDDKALQAFVGPYSSAEAFAQVRLQVQDSRLWLIRSGDERIPLTPLYTDVFMDNELSFFEFKRDDRWEITGFYVSISRASNVWFGKER